MQSKICPRRTLKRELNNYKVEVNFFYFFGYIMSEITAIISDKELKRLYEFSKKHPSHNYVIHLMQTGIGTKIVIGNSRYQEDVSDYDAW